MATGEVPKVGGTVVTIEALDMGKAWALPGAWVTVAQVGRWAALGICAQKVAGTAWASRERHNHQEALSPAGPPQPSRPTSPLTVTALSGSLPMEARLAVATAGPLCVVQTTQALPSAGITGVRVRGVNVSTALTRLAPATWL